MLQQEMYYFNYFKFVRYFRSKLISLIQQTSYLLLFFKTKLLWWVFDFFPPKLQPYLLWFQKRDLLEGYTDWDVQVVYAYSYRQRWLVLGLRQYTLGRNRPCCWILSIHLVWGQYLLTILTSSNKCNVTWHWKVHVL